MRLLGMTLAWCAVSSVADSAAVQTVVDLGLTVDEVGAKFAGTAEAAGRPAWRCADRWLCT